jgi:hypothetical protein
MTDADEAAYKLAIELYRARGPDDAAYIDARLTREGFQSAGRFASHSAQVRSLRLPPWATPPCHLLEDVEAVLARGDDGVRGDYVAATLVKKLREGRSQQVVSRPDGRAARC